jgi:hypothetical protein
MRYKSPTNRIDSEIILTDSKIIPMIRELAVWKGKWRGKAKPRT